MRQILLLTYRAGLVVAGLASVSAAVTASAEVVTVVSVKNPLTTLTKDQVADIFLGRASAFPNSVQAAPIDQAEGSATRDEFYLKYGGRLPPQVKAYWSKIIFTGRGQPPPEVANAAALKKRIADNPNAIGYLDQSAVDASVKVLQIP